MAEFNLSATMDAIAEALIDNSLVKIAYAYPVPQVSTPCAVVGFPLSVNFDLTFKRGADTITFPVFFVVGAVMDKYTRDALGVVLAGATGIKDSLDGDLDGTVQSARCTDCVIETLVIGDIEYLTAKFNLEVIT